MEFKLTAKQTLARRKLTNEEDLAVLYGGAKGGGKSFLLCLWAFEWTLWLIKFFGLENSKYPLAVGFLGRKRGVDFNDTTLETFKRIIPYDGYEIKLQEKEIVVNGVAKILYGGLDDEININKFNSAEFAFFGIDQAEETLRQDVGVLQATLRLTHKGKRPPYKELYTANPAECWLKDDFILHGRSNSVFVPALPDDNPFLPPNYKQTLRSAFSYDESLLKAYLLGDWDAFSNISDALIKASDVEACRNLPAEYDEDTDNKVVAGDVATKHGECATTICYRCGNAVIELEEFMKIPTTRTAFLLKDRYEVKKANTLVVDSDGVGEGVADMLEANRIGVLAFHGGYGSVALDQVKFRNLRTQFYYILAKKIEKHLISFKLLPQNVYEKLKRQLCMIKVKANDAQGRFQIETKEDMQARGVMSPDLADAVVYSEYGIFMGNMADLRPYAYR